MKSVRAAATVLFTVTLTACGAYAPSRMTGVITGMVSHQLCSAVFVAGLDADAYYNEALRPMAAPVSGPMDWLMSHNVDRERQQVTVKFGGMGRSRAQYRGDTGCLVMHGEEPPRIALPVRDLAAAVLPPIADDKLVAAGNALLAAALDHNFIERDSGPPRFTKAIVVVHQGRVIAEQYAPGYGIHTPVHGWSATKSVTNALLGILVRDGKVDMHARAPVAAWSDVNDPRHRITPDNLLRMASGLNIGQNLSAGFSDTVDPASQMMYVERDTAAFAERATLKHAPGSKWTYSNGNTALLARIVKDAAGGDAQSVLAFAHRELFDKLGMGHATLELDAAGTPMSATQLWASARDWARFGMLYLNDGVIAGQRILPAGWADYSATFTPGSEDFGYGAGFWTNRGDSPGALIRVRNGMPADSFMARGSFGQAVVVIPSLQLVIARFGYSHTKYGDGEALNLLVKEVVAVLNANPSSKEL